MIERKQVPAPLARPDFPFENRGADPAAEEASPEPDAVRIHVHRGPLIPASPPLPPAPQRIGSARTVARGLGAGLQAALREVAIQAASQGTQAVVRAILVSQASCAGPGRWASPVAAGLVTAVVGLRFGGHAVDVMVRGRLAPHTRLARGLLTSLPLAIDIAGVTSVALCSGIGGGVRLLAGIAARMTGCLAGGLVAQVQDRAWGGLRLVTPQGERLPASRVARDIDPLRVTLAIGMYALGCMCFLVFLVQQLADRDGGSPDSHEFGAVLHASRARAISAATMETVHAFLEALVQVAVVLRAGLAFEYVPGQPRRVLDNLLDWRGTWNRVRAYAGVRVWLGSLAGDLPAALEATFRTPGAGRVYGRLAAAHAQVLMSLRGWILQQPGEVAAQEQEARWQQLEAAAGAAAGGAGFDVIYGRTDDSLDFEPAR